MEEWNGKGKKSHLNLIGKSTKGKNKRKVERETNTELDERNRLYVIAGSTYAIRSIVGKDFLSLLGRFVLMISWYL